MKLEDLSGDEERILIQILALMHQLPMPLAAYTSPLGQLRRERLNIPGRVNLREGTGLPRRRKIRASR